MSRERNEEQTVGGYTAKDARLMRHAFIEGFRARDPENFDQEKAVVAWVEYEPLAIQERK